MRRASSQTQFHRKANVKINPIFRVLIAMLALTLALAIAGCGGDDDPASSAKPTDSLVVYSGREAELVDELYEKFEAETGVKLEVRYAESPELAATLLEEGSNSPADVFYAQDAGAIGAVAQQGSARGPISAKSIEQVPSRFRDSDRRWTGITGRARVQIYNTDEVEAAELPDSVLDLTKPEWKGRVAIAPGNASFQGFVTAMRETIGDEQTKTVA